MKNTPTFPVSPAAARYWERPPRLVNWGRYPKSLGERFYTKFEPCDGCWLWKAHVDKATGYGRLNVGSRANGTRRYEGAHRLAWMVHYGPIPEGMEICHNCPAGDNRLCVNPEHLFLGTQADNIRDAWRKGVMPQGERRSKAKLTDLQVEAIRRRYATGDVLQRELAAEYSVNLAYISMLVARSRRKDGEPAPQSRKRQALFYARNLRWAYHDHNLPF